MLDNFPLLYSTVGLMVFGFWLTLFLLDSTTPKYDKISWMILLIATILWPIVLPISVWEIIHKAKSKQVHLGKLY